MNKVLSILGLIATTLILESIFGMILWPLFMVAVVFLKTHNIFWTYFSAFGLGIISDLATGMPLGLSSIILLAFSLALFATTLRFRVDVKIAFGLIILFQVIYLVLFNFLPI